MLQALLLIFAVTLFSCNEKKTKHDTKAPAISRVKNDTEQKHPDAPFLSMPTQSDSTKAGLMKSIRNFVRNADQQAFTDSIELENDDFMENMTDGGGSLTGYFDSDKLIKMKVWIGFSWGVRQNIYYFKDGQLAYVLETEDGFYVDSTGIDHSRFDMHFEGNFYFDNNKILDHVTLGHNRFENDSNDPEKEFLETADYYKAFLWPKTR